MNRHLDSHAEGQNEGSLRLPGPASPHRRRFLRGAGGIMLGGVAAALGGCVTSAPEEEVADIGPLVYPPPPETPRFYYDFSIFGSSSVREETSSDRLRRFATGQSAAGKGMAKPFGVAVQDGRVFVTDTVSRLVHVFDYPNRRYYEMANKGVGRVAKPLGIALDQAGNVYVADQTAKRVLIYDLEGRYITAIGHEHDLQRLTSVTATPDGQRIYLLDTGGVSSRDHRVLVFDSGGRLVRTVGTRGQEEGNFNLPLDCTLGPDGKLYVLDTGNFRIQVFDPDGDFLFAFGKAGRFPGQFSHPKGIAVDYENKIYVTDTTFAVFQIFDANGRILMSIGENGLAGGGPGRFLLLAGVGVDFDSRIYVADQFFRKVDVFRAASVPEDWPIGQRLTTV